MNWCELERISKYLSLLLICLGLYIILKLIDKRLMGSINSKYK